MKLKDWISDEWQQCYKWAQVQLPVLIGGLGMLYGQVDFLQALLSPKWYSVVNGVLCMAMVANAVRKKP